MSLRWNSSIYLFNALHLKIMKHFGKCFRLIFYKGAFWKCSSNEFKGRLLAPMAERKRNSRNPPFYDWDIEILFSIGVDRASTHKHRVISDCSTSSFYHKSDCRRVIYTIVAISGVRRWGRPMGLLRNWQELYRFISIDSVEGSPMI